MNYLGEIIHRYFLTFAALASSRELIRLGCGFCRARLSVVQYPKPPYERSKIYPHHPAR